MTHEEEQRLRIILIIEGCPWEDLDELMEDFRRKPDILHSFLSDWTPVTESDQWIPTKEKQQQMKLELREAARHLLDRRDTTEDERRLATKAIEWLRSKRDEPQKASTQHRVFSSPPAGRRKSKLYRRSGQP